MSRTISSPWASTPSLPHPDGHGVLMGPMAPRSSRPSSPRAAHEGPQLIFGSSSRSRVSIARASHQRPRSLQTRASRREAPKLRMDCRPRGPQVTRTALHCDSTGDRGGGGRRPWGSTDVALPPRACAFDGRGPTSHKYSNQKRDPAALWFPASTARRAWTGMTATKAESIKRA